MTSLHTLAGQEPYCLVTDIAQCELSEFWVVHLDTGLMVFQSCDNPDLDEPNSWMRLKKFCEDNDVTPLNMAYSNKDLDSSRQINLDPLADGYFYTKRIRKLMTGDIRLSGYSDSAQGIGQLHRNTLKIIWVFDHGRVEFETRDIRDNPKSPPISIIRK